MDTIKAVIDGINGVIWAFPSSAPIMVVMLLGSGIFLTLRFKFINLRGFKHAVNVVRGVYDDPDDPGDISHFQALTTALSATVGIGNIAGVATAIHYGGPGALFWMWVTAFFGMTTKYTECTLAMHYRVDNADGSVSGGPMYYIEKGLGPGFKPLAMFFAACAVISSFGSGNGVQAFTMADSFRSDLGLPTWLTAGVSAVAVGLVIVGGIKRIGSFASKVMPSMAVLYFVAAVVVLAMHAAEIPAALVEIISGAFDPKAMMVGAFSGATFAFTLKWGVKRGLFSNEAGQGSAPIAHAAAKTDHAVREGAVALLEPFVDTLVICTLTGLMIVTTGVWKETKPSTYELKGQSAIVVVSDQCKLEPTGVIGRTCALTSDRLAVRKGRLQGAHLVLNHTVVTDAEFKRAGELVNGTLKVSLDRDPKGKRATTGVKPAIWDDNEQRLSGVKMTGSVLLNGSPLTARALKEGLDPIFPFGNFIVTLSVFLFALSTAIGWSYYGDRSAQYLFGERVILPYRLVFVVMHFVGGAIASLEGIWGFGDAALGLMSFPNLVTILILSGTVGRLTNEYFAKDHVPFKDRKQS